MGKAATVLAVQVIIDIGITTKVSKEIWPWELAVYQEKYGEGSCPETGIVEITRVLPDASEEFVKLSSSLGVDEDTKISFVELAYGRGKQGVIALEKAIKKSTSKPKAKKPPKEKAKPGPKPKVEEKPEAEPKAEAEASDGKNRDPLG